MPYPIPEGQSFTIEHGKFPADSCMPFMQMATDHYNIGYTVSGDRRCITPTQTYDYHSGDVSMQIPYVYHRTVAETDKPYERFLIKFTPKFAEPFISHMGQHFFDELFRLKVCRFHTDAREKIKRMFFEIYDEYQKDTPYKEFILQGMLFRLLCSVWEERIPEELPALNPSPLTKSMIDAVYLIETHYNQNLSLEETARTAGLSTAYFSRLFRAQLGIPFSEYVRNVRIHHAKILLSQSSKSITEIALETGFCSGDYFSSQFKAKTGMTPSTFRNRPK